MRFENTNECKKCEIFLRKINDLRAGTKFEDTSDGDDEKNREERRNRRFVQRAETHDNQDYASDSCTFRYLRIHQKVFTWSLSLEDWINLAALPRT